MLKLITISLIVIAILYAYIKAMKGNVDIIASSHSNISNAFYMGIIIFMLIITGMNMLFHFRWLMIIYGAIGVFPIFIYMYMINLFNTKKKMPDALSISGLICLNTTCVIFMIITLMTLL